MWGPVSIPRKGLEVLVRDIKAIRHCYGYVSIPRKGLEVLVPLATAYAIALPTFQSLGRG